MSRKIPAKKPKSTARVQMKKAERNARVATLTAGSGERRYGKVPRNHDHSSMR